MASERAGRQFYPTYGAAFSHADSSRIHPAQLPPRSQESRLYIFPAPVATKDEWVFHWNDGLYCGMLYASLSTIDNLNYSRSRNYMFWRPLESWLVLSLVGLALIKQS